MPQPGTPAGWYADPQDPQQQRYWDGAAWTENRAPAAPPAPVPTTPAKAKKPWYLRWWAITAAVVVVLIVIGNLAGGSDDTQPTNSGSTNSGSSKSGSSNSGSSTTSDSKQGTSKSKKSSSGQSAGLDADAGHANPVKAGSAFTLGDFDIKRGWKIKNIGYGLGFTINNLSVQNVTDGDHTFDVEFKLRTGSRIAADISCFANQAAPKDIVEVDCLPDGSGKSFQTVTIENAM